MRNSPTLSELRLRVHKKHHRTIGNIMARRYGRPAAVYGTYLAVRWNLSANQITAAAVLVGFASALAFAAGSPPLFVAGVLLAHLGYWLDHVDGQVARYRGTSSLSGVYFDYLMHHWLSLQLGFALGFGAAIRSGDLRWTLAGFLTGAGWLFLGLHNDCRYKAFFQRLKSTQVALLVDPSPQDRPRPPEPWRLRGRAFFVWPALKLCEQHIVLLSLTLLMLPAIVAPLAWSTLLNLYILGMAFLAPSLALARVTRAIQTRAADMEFDRWFKPDHAPGATRD